MKYEIIYISIQEEYVGPMEATINNLVKAVSQKEKEYYEMQQLWIRSQTDLIKLSKKNVKMSEEIQDLKMRSTILDRKRIVINSKISILLITNT